MKQQINFRASDLTASQLDALMQHWGTSQTETLTVVIDRMYQQEQRTMSASYDTREDAEADGWTKNIPAGWTKKDTSGYNSFGYEFTATSPDGTKQAVTTGIWIRNAENRMGKPGAVVNYYRAEDFA